MYFHNTLRTAAAILTPLFFCAAGCEQEPQGKVVPMPQAAAPAGHPAGQPAGHPISGAAGQPAGQPMPGTIAPPPPGSGTGQAGLTWTAPQGWEQQTPKSRMRRAQYRIPGTAGDAELVVFYFGPNQGGDPMANAQRWASQFSKADGSPATDQMKTGTRSVNGIEVLTVEVNGTYISGMPMGPKTPKNDHMLLGAVAKGPDANWFFKLTGPKGTVESTREAFEQFIQSLKQGS